MLKNKAKKTTLLVRILFSLLVALVVFTVGLYIKDSTVSAYTGTFPCADCDGVKTTLTLFGTGDYTLNSIYIDKGDPYTEKGTWQQVQKNNMQEYALKSDKNITSYYEIINDTTIKMLDMHGGPMKNRFNMTLKKK